MSTVDESRAELQAYIAPYGDTVTKVRRAYFDRQSYALAEKHEVEFEIKALFADRYKVPFRSVVFTGSAQLGFSPHKDTAFIQGSSDLDVAIIDNRLYQEVWEIVLRRTDAFNDLSTFYSQRHAELFRSHMLKRAMILLDYMPRCPERSKESVFLDDISLKYRKVFGRVSLAVYMNEMAFCFKQKSALANIMGSRDAE